MTHGMSFGQHTFVGIQNSKRNMKTLTNELTSCFVDKSRFLLTCCCGQASHLALHHVFADTAVQVCACPFNFDVHDAFKDLIDTADNNR